MLVWSQDSEDLVTLISHTQSNFGCHNRDVDEDDANIDTQAHIHRKTR